MRDYVFKWLRWIDPIGRNLDEIPEFADEEDVEEIQSEYEEMEKRQYDGQKSAPFLAVTSAGLIPLAPYNNPAKAFNFWDLHVNFKLTEKMVRIIDDTLGVEMLTGISPYRVRVAIGKAFDEKLVQGDIKRELLKLLPKVYKTPQDQEI